MASLLDPLKVKGLTLKNRIVMPPMHTGLATTKGTVTDKLIRHYQRRSQGLGLLVVEFSSAAPFPEPQYKPLTIFDDAFIPGLQRLCSGVHAMGTPVAIQIDHPGTITNQDVKEKVAPSPRGGARELRVDEMEAIAAAFADAAERAMEAGFDGVEIHGGHGFLLNQFFSPLANRRQDRYGGTLENRMRFPLEVVARVKKRVGGGLLFYRVGADDLHPLGTKIKDAMKFSIKLEEAGVDVIDVTGGLCGYAPVKLKGRPGFFVPQAQKIKKVVKVPVIGVGGITDAKYADLLVREGSVDLVAVGRALFKDPDWAVRAIKNIVTENALKM